MEEQIPSEINNPQNKPLLIVAAMVAIIFLLLLVALIFKKKVTTPKSAQSTPSVTKIIPTVKPKQGSMTLKKATGENSIVAKLNATTNLTISLDSMGFDMVGYDVIVSYDPQQLEIVQATSLLPEFTLFKIKRESYMVLTGAKKPSATAQTVLTNKDIINVTIKPKITGTVSLNIMTEQGKETTKFVDNATVVHYPQVNSINIEVTKSQ